jgi:hypothetical protein
MWKKIQKYFPGLSMESFKGIATIAIMIGVFTICLAAGWISTKYLGDDNIIEDDLEEIAEDEAEDLTHTPKGSLKKEVDALFPHKKD